MNNYIYQKHNSLSKNNCNKIIELFEKETNSKYEGVTFSGLNKNIKNTTDYSINKNDNNWTDIYNLLVLELQINLKNYINSLYINSFDEKYKYFENSDLSTNDFMIQRYIKSHGKYIYHHDFSKRSTEHRVITFLWYLNTIEEGGETEFWGNYKIKPEEGKLIFFPSLWCFPHCGSVPISDNKYIITGWLYEKYKIETTIPNKFLQRFIIDIFFTESICEWLITEVEQYNTNTQSDYISFELLNTISNFILIKVQKLFNKLKEYYNLSNTQDLKLIKLHFIKTIDNERIDNETNTDKQLLKFYIPLSEYIDFFFNDGTSKKILFGNLFLFSDKNISYKSRSKYYLYGLIQIN